MMKETYRQAILSKIFLFYMYYAPNSMSNVVALGP